MLRLSGITKDYGSGADTVHALRGIDIEFGKSEFVAVLGPSGCGKTTLLNVIGGLDRYSAGDLEINGVSTKEFNDRDWDTYRNHSVGFVFQSYNLIPHQTVLANVELALTLSGVKKAERRRRAKEALEKVGLGDQLKKKPAQLSGGQTQRVAIARALVNSPEVLLADEPTGALDTDTGVQVMELLSEVARDRLVIMVTHNPELAEKYATRTVRLLDGRIVGDTGASAPAGGEKQSPAGKIKPARIPSMSFVTAMSLSLRNLMTKKTRTLLTSFAGSIGIIGIALILAFSNGIQLYIDRVQEDTLSAYPIRIDSESTDFSAFISAGDGSGGEESDHGLDAVYSSTRLYDMLNSVVSGTTENNLTEFKKFLDTDPGISKYASAVQYVYPVPLNIYRTDISDPVKVSPTDLFDVIYGGYASSFVSAYADSAGMEIWSELLDDRDLLESQYEVLEGEWPDASDPSQIVLVVNKRNEISDIAMYCIGLKDMSELDDVMQAVQKGETVDSERIKLDYSDLLGLEYTVVLPTDYYSFDSDTGVWKDMSENEEYMASVVENGLKLKVTAIIRPSEDAATASVSGVIGYGSSLTDYLMKAVNSSGIVLAQQADPKTNVFTGLEFGISDREVTMEDVNAWIDLLDEDTKAQVKSYMAAMTEEQIISMFSAQLHEYAGDSTYEDNLKVLGVCDISSPSSVLIYAATFDDKELVADRIKAYNSDAEANGREENVIVYTDYVALLMSTVSTIVGFVSYALIAFVSISLVVSSIMIGIITYISVLERTKEIGILRSIGASKRDIARVFNTETAIVGFTAGCIGILLTLVLIYPLNCIIGGLSGVRNIASLPPAAAAVLIAVSVLLTVTAGLIPAFAASAKDPVVALRSE